MITYPNLYHLRYFADAVELGSIVGSARKNSVTHPAVSRAIAALEGHLRVQLLEHRKKSFKVTEAGYRVAEQARALLSAASKFNSLGLDSELEGGGTIVIGVSRTLSEPYLNPLLLGIKKRFPNARAQVRFGTTNEITEAVAKNSADLGITIGTQNLPTLEQRAIHQGKFLLVETANRGAYRNKWRTKPFIVTEPRFETELLKKEYQRHFKSALPVIFEISSWEVIGQLVQRGFGVGLVPDVAIKGWRKESYRILKPTWFSCEYEVYVHYRKMPFENHILRHAVNLLIR